MAPTEVSQPPAATPTPASSPAPVTITDPANVVLYTFTVVDTGGVKVQATLKLVPPQQADDPGLVNEWQAMTGTTLPAPACVSTPSRDAVVIGSLSFHNATPSYPPSSMRIVIIRNGLSTSNALFEVHYANSAPECQTIAGGEQATVSPDMANAANWGPVPVAFTIPDLYGPDGFDTSTYNSTATLQLALPTTARAGTNTTVETNSVYLGLPKPE